MSHKGGVGGTGDKSSTGVCGDDGDKVTITVHSSVSSVVNKIFKKFEDYMGKLGRQVNVKLTSTPIVKLTNITTSEHSKKKKDDDVRITKLAVMASVCASDGKSLKIYVDEDLILEEKIVSRNLQPAITKGKELIECYFFNII